MRATTPPTGTKHKTPQEALRALPAAVKGMIGGGAAALLLVGIMYAYNASYEANLFAERQAEMLELIGTLHTEDPLHDYDTDFQVEMTNSVMGKLGRAVEDKYITLDEMRDIELDVRKWKVLKRAYGE